MVFILQVPPCRTVFMTQELTHDSVEGRIMIRAEDIMTRHIIDVMESEDVYQAFSKFHQHHIRQLLVVNVDSELCGIVSDRDILRVWAEVTNSPGYSFPKVHSVMTRDVLTCTPDDQLTQITEMMLEHRIHAIPVVSARRRPLGIITSTDLLRVGLKNLNLLNARALTMTN